jgi:hypothetical protein
MKSSNPKLTAADEKLAREIFANTGADDVAQLNWYSRQLLQQSKQYARVAALKRKNPRLWRDLGLAHMS